MSRIGYNSGDPLGQVMSPSDNALAGAITATIGRAVSQPFDVLKIRLQLQAEDSKNAKYRSMRHGFLCILREEGVFAYWRGHVPGQALSILYGAISVGLYQTIWHYTEEKRLNLSSTKMKKTVSDLLIGTCAGIPATIASYPFDIIRTRLVCQNPVPSTCTDTSLNIYKGTFNAFTDMINKEGWRALYKGLSASIYTVPIYNGLCLCLYNNIKPFLLPYMTKVDEMNIPLLSDFATGFVGGSSVLIAKTMTYPLDTAKKRLQVQGFGKSRAAMGETPQYQGLYNCLITIFRNEGITKGLYKGWVPGIIKAFPGGVVQFILLERSLYFVGKARKRKLDSSD